MTATLGEIIHGGNIIVRREVDNMWRYLPATERTRQEAALLAEARRQFPWAPRKLAVSYGQAMDYHYYLTVELPVPDRIRAEAVEQRLRAAEQTRCACGDYGSWDCSIAGSSGDRSCVWAGCPNCTGTAVGRPILTVDLSWYERQAQSSRPSA